MLLLVLPECGVDAPAFAVRHAAVAYFDAEGRPLDPRQVPLTSAGRQQALGLCALQHIGGVHAAPPARWRRISRLTVPASSGGSPTGLVDSVRKSGSPATEPVTSSVPGCG